MRTIDLKHSVKALIDKMSAAGSRVQGMYAATLLLWTVLVPGCIYVPVGPRPLKTAEPMMPMLLGSKNSDRPLSVGVSKANVLNLLGPPLYESTDGRQFAYVFSYISGYWVGLIIRIGVDTDPPFDVPRYRCYTAVLRFDRDDKMDWYDLRWHGSGSSGLAMNDFMEMTNGIKWLPGKTEGSAMKEIQ